MARKPTGRKAWLITWDWAGEHARVPDDEVIAAILRPQTGAETVRRIMEYLYAMRQYEAIDKLDMLDSNPYPAEFNAVTHEFPGDPPFRQTVKYEGQIICGHNPFLYARRVDNLRPRSPDSPSDGLTWDERPPPRRMRSRGE